MCLASRGVAALSERPFPARSNETVFANVLTVLGTVPQPSSEPPPPVSNTTVGLPLPSINILSFGPPAFAHVNNWVCVANATATIVRRVASPASNLFMVRLSFSLSDAGCYREMPAPSQCEQAEWPAQHQR